MKKSQKIWLWVFIIMFIIPEIFFSFIFSWVPGVSHFVNNHFFYEYFIDPQFFVDNPIFLFIALSVEFLGALGIFIWNIKFNYSKYKIFLTIPIFFILVFLAFVFYVGYAVTHINFF